MKTLIMSVVTVSSIFATALPAGPRIEPGRPVALDSSATEAVDALILAKAGDIRTFIKAGNITKEISRQNLKPGVTSYTFVRQQCHTGGIAAGLCLGGASLNVIITEVRAGSMVQTQAVSRVSLLR